MRSGGREPHGFPVLIFFSKVHGCLRMERGSQLDHTSQTMLIMIPSPSAQAASIANRRAAQHSTSHGMSVCPSRTALERNTPAQTRKTVRALPPFAMLASSVLLEGSLQGRIPVDPDNFSALTDQRSRPRLVLVTTRFSRAQQRVAPEIGGHRSGRR